MIYARLRYDAAHANGPRRTAMPRVAAALRRVAVLLLAGHVLPAAAQELVIGLSTPVTSLDPHFHNLSPNNNVADHLFDKLVHKDAREQFEMRIHRRLIEIVNPQQKAVEALTGLTLPTGVHIDVSMMGA
jgi:ABC-type oligopeptide transport system substrate-binding subunit